MNTSFFDTSKIRGLILDMDGVLWRDDQPLGDLPNIFQKIDGLGLGVILATNNATKTPDIFLEKLAGFGVHLEPWQVINSALATANYLKKQFPQGGNIFVVGEDNLKQILAERGFQHRDQDILAVVAALDRGITYDKLRQASLFIQNGVPFIGTNPDPSFPIPQGVAPGAGAVLSALQATTGIKPTIIGKPKPDMYFTALERLGTSPEETLVIGDRLETDIAGAQNAGCPCALVLSGVTTLEAAKKWHPAPDLITENLQSVIDLFMSRE